MHVEADAQDEQRVADGRDQQGQYVYVVGNGDEVERREVVLGDRVEGGIIVTDGVAPDDRVIVAGQLSALTSTPARAREIIEEGARRAMTVIGQVEAGQHLLQPVEMFNARQRRITGQTGITNPDHHAIAGMG